jgi:hypothetical protein
MVMQKTQHEFSVEMVQTGLPDSVAGPYHCRGNIQLSICGGSQ